jgi:hypothetical protein
MSATLTVLDESTTGAINNRRTLEFPTESITVRELIRERVYQEVQDYNRQKLGSFNGLIQPTEAEIALNGYKLRPGREINWKAQYDKACEAYTAHRILVLTGDHQTESLEETITIGRGTEVTFLRLMPLVGG